MQRENRLLLSLSQSDQDLIRPHLEPVELRLRQPLTTRNRTIEHIYFPDAGVASIVAFARPDREVEVGIVGHEGLTGLPAIFGSSIAAHNTFMQIAGHGRRISAHAVYGMMGQSSSLQNTFLRYAHVLLVQTAETVLASSKGNLSERLARWLLMADDRVSGAEIELTHEFLALMLGVRRAGVTTAINQLREKRLVSAHRGSITILNRTGLLSEAHDFYGVPEAQYDKLFGSAGRYQ